ncbi:hypothetical protein DUNSADRAFT_12424 [Dunaliella salina]|uniref:Cilium assembly protein DZIP1 N-terminal domain-containing protein n=1 Tax=Dunaliella salina TaxID=3046 RepID=A0ABQ7GBA1_DUNSA|nr:hypothetical protein DUNSADRAFT_12424 [Dunaliella salina]|eukprot:KAF5831887.1 hypothetical protein DUNSADRAFT_12424 [Dunaliella salina]
MQPCTGTLCTIVPKHLQQCSPVQGSCTQSCQSTATLQEHEAIEYLWHMRNAHISLLDRYHAAINIADSWAAAARAYLEAGHTFLGSCMQTGDIERMAVQGLDHTRRALEEQDAHYNAALDKLEDEDQRARYFHFRKQRAEIQWQLIYSVDLDDLAAGLDASALDKVLPNLVYGSITSEDCEELTPHHFGHLIPLGQAGLDYMMFQANSTGAALEQAMAGLQAACSDIPTLTAATQDLHIRVTDFLRDTRQHATQLSMLGTPDRPHSAQPALPTPTHIQQLPVGRSQLRFPLLHPQQQQQRQQLPMFPGSYPPNTVHPQPQQLLYPPGYLLPLQQPPPVQVPQQLLGQALQGGLTAGDLLQQHQQGVLPFAQPGGAAHQAPSLGPSPMGTSITGGLAVGPTGMPLGASPEELHALSQLGVPLQALGVYQRASQLNAGMDGLEHELRLERVRTEEMRQLVRSLKGSLRMSVEGPKVLEPHSLSGHSVPGQVEAFGPSTQPRLVEHRRSQQHSVSGSSLVEKIEPQQSWSSGHSGQELSFAGSDNTQSGSATSGIARKGRAQSPEKPTHMRKSSSGGGTGRAGSMGRGVAW